MPEPSPQQEPAATPDAHTGQERPPAPRPSIRPFLEPVYPTGYEPDDA